MEAEAFEVDDVVFLDEDGLIEQAYEKDNEQQLAFCNSDGEIHMLIRRENESNYKKIYDVVKTAFESAEHADGNEQDLVNALRNGTSYIPELSLVAEADGSVVGHIMFTKAQVDEVPVLALQPL